VIGCVQVEVHLLVETMRLTEFLEELPGTSNQRLEELERIVPFHLSGEKQKARRYTRASTQEGRENGMRQCLTDLVHTARCAGHHDGDEGRVAEVGPLALNRLPGRARFRNVLDRLIVDERRSRCVDANVDACLVGQREEPIGIVAPNAHARCDEP
jgi:hypothetical protein